MVIFSKLQRSISSKAIDDIEQYINFKFPEEYRKHLLKYNGGRCTPNIFNFIENGKETNSDVDWFLAVNGGEHNDIKEEIDIYKIDEKRMPEHIVPIAFDSCGNMICISCGTSDYGYIYFWDHENEVDYTVSGDDDYSNLYLIAKSFNEFLNSLTSLEE